MAYCTQCGAENDGGVFCTSCGERLSAATATAIATTPGKVTEFLRALGPGDKAIVGGAALAVLSFFLPWVSVSFLGQRQTMTGIGALQFTGTVLLEPLVAAVSIAVAFLTRGSSSATKVRAAGWQILLGATFALPGVGALIVPIPFLAGSLSVGWWALTLGYLAIVVGAMMTLNHNATTALSRS